MRKSDIAREISEKFDLQPDQSDKILNVLIESMADALKNDQRIEIREFGSFFTRGYRSYQGRNPRTGRRVHVPTKKLPRFKVSKELIKRMNG